MGEKKKCSSCSAEIPYYGALRCSDCERKKREREEQDRRAWDQSIQTALGGMDGNPSTPW